MRRPTLRTTTALSTQEGILNIEFVPGPRGYVWIGLGSRALGFCGIKGLRQFVASCEKAQERERRATRRQEQGR